MLVLNALGLDGRLALKPYLQVGLSLLAAKVVIILGVMRLLVWPDAPVDDTQTARLLMAGLDLLLLWPFIVLNVRRSHDRGYAGRVEAFAVVYATICWILPDAWTASVLPGWVSIALTNSAGSVALFITLVNQLDHRPFGDNRYGPGAQAPETAQAA